MKYAIFLAGAALIFAACGMATRFLLIEHMRSCTDRGGAIVLTKGEFVCQKDGLTLFGWRISA